MRKIYQIAIGLTCCVGLIISCKTTKTGTTSTTATTTKKDPTPVPAVVLSYNSPINNILDKNCNGCHSNPEKQKGDFTKYVGLKAKIDNGTFKTEVLDKKTMPPKEPLSSEDYAKLKLWFEQGAIE